MSSTLLRVFFGSFLFVFNPVSVSAQVAVPAGIPADLFELLIPPDNPLSEEKIALGERLYFDQRLSLDNTVSCATCHDPNLAFTDGKKTSEGIRGQSGARNAPTVLNTHFNEEQFWDGRAATLEEQALGPLINPIEMGFENHDQVVARLREIPEYDRTFKAVFNSPVTIENVGRAIASFERTILSGDSPFDRFMAGDSSALSPSARRGWNLFEGRARCLTCHEFNPSNPFFTDYKYHNVGVAMHQEGFEELALKARQLALQGRLDEQQLDQMALDPAFSELGRFLVTLKSKDIGAFKTSSLRNVEQTAPYMHDGSEATLLEVVEFYDRGGNPNPNLDGGIRPLNLTAEEKQDLVELMNSFTGRYPQNFTTNQ